MIQYLNNIFNVKNYNVKSPDKIFFFFLILSYVSSRIAIGINQILVHILFILSFLIYFGFFDFTKRFVKEKISNFYKMFFFFISEISILYILSVRFPWLLKNIDSGTLLFLLFIPLSIILQLSISENAIISITSFSMIPLLILSSSSVTAEIFTTFSYLILLFIILQEMKSAISLKISSYKK